MPRVLSDARPPRRPGQLRDAVVVRQPQAVVVRHVGAEGRCCRTQVAAQPLDGGVRRQAARCGAPIRRPTTGRPRRPSPPSAVASRETENAGPPYEASRLVAVINTFMADADE